MSERRPAELFPPGSFIEDEMEARGWDGDDMADRMTDGDRDSEAWAVNRLALDMLILDPDPRIEMGEGLARDIARAFGVNPQTLLNMDANWRKWANERN